MSKCKVDSLAPHYEPMPQKMFSEKEASLSTDAIFFYVMFCQVGTIYANMLSLFLLFKVTRFRADQITKLIIKIHPLNNCHIRQIKQTSSMMYGCSCRKLYRPIIFHLPFCYWIRNWLLFVTEKHLKIFKFVERLGVMPQYLTNELSKVKENIAAETGFNFHSTLHTG